MEAVGETGAALPCRLTDGTGTACPAWPTLLFHGGFWLVVLPSFPHGMKLENVKIKTRIRRRYP